MAFWAINLARKNRNFSFSAQFLAERATGNGPQGGKKLQ
jgi:hypothetical protein